MKLRLKESMLLETTVEDKFAKATPLTEAEESITEVLDHCAELAEDFYDTLAAKAKRGQINISAKSTNVYNPLFIGPTGAGKTSIISTWARDKGYEIITINMMGDALDFLGVKSIDRDYELEVDDNGTKQKTPRVATIPTKAFDAFLRGKTKILFLDEINKTDPTILQSLYDIISFHTVQNGDDVMYLPKLLFTVGAMNPSTYGGSRETLDPALKARMQIYHVDYDVESLGKYLLASLNQNIQLYENELRDLGDDPDSDEARKWIKRYQRECGRKDLAEAVFASRKNFFTDAETIADADEDKPVSTPRTFEAALFNCDGTRASFISWVKRLCGLDAADTINNILANYKDKDHKANQIWGKDYSVKTEPEKKKAPSAEGEIANSASEEEKADAEVKTNLFDKLSKQRRTM